jgi:hypothetical protein
MKYPGNHGVRVQPNVFANRMKQGLLVLLGLTALGIQKCKSIEMSEPGAGTTDTTTYSCKGKTQCGEMVSCKEATYYLRNCPNVQIDGDGDGVPCEEQWCGR